MSRWEPDAGERLRNAALELFVEQGFADTTVPQITARAGLTTRTFFRHFADKREVLFTGEDELPEMVAQMMASAPSSLRPMQLIAEGLDQFAAARFDGRFEQLRTRKAVVESDEGLRERELRKMSALSEAIRLGFVRRGVDELTATVAAHLSGTVFGVGIRRWLDQPSPGSGQEIPLSDFLHETLDALLSLTVVDDRAVEPEPAGADR